MLKRNTKVADSNKLMIHLDPEIHRAYMESTQVSSKYKRGQHFDFHLVFYLK